MPHTQSRYMQDLGNVDGRLFVGPQGMLVSGTTVLTRTAAGNWNFAQGNSQTVIYAVNVTEQVMRRTGVGEDLQQQFGGAGVAGSAQIRTYRPDVIRNMNTGQQLQPRTSNKTKGFNLLGFSVTYKVAGAALTAHTCRVDSHTFSNNVADSIAALLASGANGLQTVVQTNPYVTVVSIAGSLVPGGNYFVTQTGEVFIEVSAQTAGGGTYVLYGIDLSIDFNLN